MTRDELRDVLTFAIKRAFISQPMGGITDVAYRDCADAALSAIEGAIPIDKILSGNQLTIWHDHGTGRTVCVE